MDLTPDAARAAARAADAAERPDETYRLLLPLAEAGDQPVGSSQDPGGLVIEAMQRSRTAKPAVNR
jgi:hypothetical protein